MTGRGVLAVVACFVALLAAGLLVARDDHVVVRDESVRSEDARAWPVVAHPVLARETEEKVTRFGWCNPNSDGCWLPWDVDERTLRTYGLGPFHLRVIDHRRAAPDVALSSAHGGGELALTTGYPHPATDFVLRSDGRRYALTWPDGLSSREQCIGVAEQRSPPRERRWVLALAGASLVALVVGAAITRSRRHPNAEAPPAGPYRTARGEGGEPRKSRAALLCFRFAAACALVAIAVAAAALV